MKYLSESLKVNTTLTRLYANCTPKSREYLSRNEKLQSMSLPDELVSFLNTEYLSDMTIRSKNGEQIRAHRIVLAAMSRCAFIFSDLSLCTKSNRSLEMIYFFSTVQGANKVLCCRLLRDLLVEKSSQQKAGTDTLTEIDVDIPSQFLRTIVRVQNVYLFCLLSLSSFHFSNPSHKRCDICILE